MALPLQIAGLCRLPRLVPFSVVPPFLCLLPLVPHDDGKRVDEEDLNDLNDANDRAAHPEAQLATEVGKKNDELEENTRLWAPVGVGHVSAAPLLCVGRLS